METIFNYKCTEHFTRQMRRRRIEPFLVSLCLAKGRKFKNKANRKLFILDKEFITEAISDNFVAQTDCLGFTRILVVTQGNQLITAFAKYGDTGISSTF